MGKREGQAKQEDNELLNHGQTKIRLWKTAPCDVTKSIETSPMSVSSNPEAVPAFGTDSLLLHLCLCSKIVEGPEELFSTKLKCKQ